MHFLSCRSVTVLSAVLAGNLHASKKYFSENKSHFVHFLFVLYRVVNLLSVLPTGIINILWIVYHIFFWFLKKVVASVTPETYYECEQYTGGQWEQIDKTRRKCIRETVGGEDLLFCRHWECEQPKCPEDEQITSEDGCKSCPG